MPQLTRGFPGFVFIAAGAVALAAQAGQHDQHAGPAPDKIGAAHVNFRTSCAAAVKDDFNRSVALLHSFWFPEARAAFQAVAKKDPACAMAYWGSALTLWGNPFGGLRTPEAIQAGRSVIATAQSTGSPTPRERAYIDAVAGLFSDADPGTQRARVVAYEAAMERLAKANPDDAEAQIFWALAVTQTALPTDKTYAQNLKAAAILEPLFKKMPEHPGIAHYIIHAYDVPALAPRALDAARRYASLAPAVPHALHMPSHTFTRVGDWRDSIKTNLASADAARQSRSSGDELHALDYQAYAYLQIAHDAAAMGAIDRARQVVSSGEGATAGAAGAGAFALAAMPARYALERRQWAEAAQLPVPTTGTPFTQAMTHFARAIGLARSGNPGAVPAELTALAGLRDRLLAAKDAYWAEQVDVQRRVAEAWMQFAQGQRDAGLALLKAAADAEDATDKAAISPGPLAPARELLGFMLLEARQPAPAQAAFEAVMLKEPNRFLAIFGAAQAAEAQKQTAVARKHYQQLAEMCHDAPAGRADLDLARKMAGAAGQATGGAGQSRQSIPATPIRPVGEPAAPDAFPTIPPFAITAPDHADAHVDELLATLDRLLATHTDSAKWQAESGIDFWRFQNRLERGRLSDAQAARVAARFDAIAAARPAHAAYVARRKWIALNIGVGKAAPDIVGKDFDGVEFKLSDMRGKVTVLVFTGEWCGPCRSEYPYQRLMLELHKDKPFAIVGVNSDAKLEVARQGKVDSRLAYRSWWDGHREQSTKGPIAEQWGITGWPTIYILDKAGVIRFAGLRHEDALKAVAQLLQ